MQYRIESKNKIIHFKKRDMIIEEVNKVANIV